MVCVLDKGIVTDEGLVFFGMGLLIGKLRVSEVLERSGKMFLWNNIF